MPLTTTNSHQLWWAIGASSGLLAVPSQWMPKGWRRGPDCWRRWRGTRRYARGSKSVLRAAFPNSARAIRVLKRNLTVPHPLSVSRRGCWASSWEAPSQSPTGCRAASRGSTAAGLSYCGHMLSALDLVPLFSWLAPAAAAALRCGDLLALPYRGGCAAWAWPCSIRSASASPLCSQCGAS
jgi:hypothetical protein